MSKCEKCGEPLEKGVKFCASCGTVVSDSASDPAVCVKCGKPIGKGVKFCASCGTPATGGSASGQEFQEGDPADVEEYKTMAIIAYFLFFVPLITGDFKKSPFLKFHTNQSLLVVITAVAFNIASFIIRMILRGAFLAPIRFLISLAGWAPLILFVIGIINAVNGRMKPLPIIGKYVILK